MVRSLLVLSLAAGSAGAQTIYRWTDGRGIVHYSDDASTAPKGVKVDTTEGEELNAVQVSKPDAPKRLATAQGDPFAAPPPPPPPGALGDVLPVPPPPEDGEDERLTAEQYWRRAFRDVREKIRSLEDEIALDEKKVGDPSIISSAGCGAYTVNRQGARLAYPYDTCAYAMRDEYHRARERLASNRAALVRARDDLTDLERRAANASVPLEWRR